MSQDPQIPQTNDKNIVIEDIFTALGVNDISDSDKIQLFSSLIDSVQIRTIATIFDMLDEEKKKELETIIDQEDGRALDIFFDKYVPNHDEIFTKEALELRRELVQDFARKQI